MRSLKRPVDFVTNYMEIFRGLTSYNNNNNFPLLFVIKPDLHDADADACAGRDRQRSSEHKVGGTYGWSEEL
jgi:hypothetical protein